MTEEQFRTAAQVNQMIVTLRERREDIANARYFEWECEHRGFLFFNRSVTLRLSRWGLVLKNPTLQQETDGQLFKAVQKAAIEMLDAQIKSLQQTLSII